MPFWVFIFTNPLSLFLYFVAFELVLKIISLVMKYIKHIPWQFPFKQRLSIYVVFILISTVAHCKILFTNDHRKSLVDVSPIAQLSSEQVYHLEDVLEKFNDYDFISRFNIHDRSDIDIESKFALYHDFYKSYSMWWFESGLFKGLDIYISFYRNKEDAIKYMQLKTRGDRYTLITNDNDTEIMLFDSTMERGGHAFPVSDRYLRSAIRFGNAIIELSETPEQHQLHKSISGDFIKLLCELLSQYEKVPSYAEQY